MSFTPPKDAAVMCFTMNSLSHRVIDDEYFKRYGDTVAKTKGSISVNRKQLRDAVIKKGADIKQASIMV